MMHDQNKKRRPKKIAMDDPRVERFREIMREVDKFREMNWPGKSDAASELAELVIEFMEWSGLNSATPLPKNASV
jgi:hypothetical protein